MISGRKYQRFPSFHPPGESIKQAKFRLSDIQPVYLKKTAQFRGTIALSLLNFRVVILLQERRDRVCPVSAPK
jgi:hypothetical protein